MHSINISASLNNSEYLKMITELHNLMVDMKECCPIDSDVSVSMPRHQNNPMLHWIFKVDGKCHSYTVQLKRSFTNIDYVLAKAKYDITNLLKGIEI